ncbi:hypothetical protein PTNB29_10373 [Pyrenophora teres f. teres]|nr:hypothetical protein PTNB29_10373 [Pyrenophora teres f. teres]
MADVGRKRALDGDGPTTMRKKLRPSELPLSQAKRAAIDGLVHMFQKKGTYDDIRRDLMKQYVSGPAKDELQSALKDLVERETDRNPSLLSKDPRMATTLIEGAGERSDIYGNIMNTVNTLLDRLIQEQGLPKMREYRIQEIGAEAAAEEEKRGSKSEEEWAQEAEARREKREARREKELEEEREREREERAKKEERKRREREEDEAREKVRQEEKERRRKEREERDKEDEERRRKDRERIDKEREEERLRLKKEREEHEKSREARLKKIREEDAERERRIQEELDRDRGGRRRGGRGRSRTPERDRDRRGRDRSRRRSRTRTRSPERRPSLKSGEIKVDDDLALQLLLQESEQMKKSRQRPALERSESLEPPMRKAQPPKSLVPRDPATTRLAKLEGKSTSPAHGSPSKDSKTPAPKTPTTLTKDDDTAMTDAPSVEKLRWDHAPELSSKVDKSRGRSRSRSVARSNRLVMQTTAGLDGMTIDIRTDLHGGIEMTGKTNTRAMAAAVAHGRRILAAANRATGLAVLRHLEKNGVVIVRARGLGGDGASASANANAAATVLVLGVPTTLIVMYQVAALQPVKSPVNARTVETASVRIVGLGNVTTAVTVHEATVLETTTVGTAVENEEVGV